MKIVCPRCGEVIIVSHLGRKKKEQPVKNILDTYERLKTIRATARRLELPPGRIWWVLKREGVI